MRTVLSVFLLAAFCILIPIAHAQVIDVSDATAPPKPGAGHDYVGMLNDIVNPATGALSIHIELPVPSGRKLTLPLAFQYDSNRAWFYIRRSNPGNCSASGHCDPPKGYAKNSSAYGPLTRGGWSVVFPQLSFSTVSQYPSMANAAGVITDGHPTCDGDGAYLFTDTVGTNQQLDLLHLFYPNSQACQASNPRMMEIDLDTSSFGPYQANMIGAGSTILVSSPSGTVYTFGNGGFPNSGATTALPSSIKDSNGNSIQISASAPGPNVNVTDSAGRTELTIPTFGTTTSSVTVAGQLYQMNWQQISASGFHVNSQIQTTDTNCAPLPANVGAIDPVNFTLGTKAVSTITLPNGQNYTFDYDPVTGFVTKITYPSGGYVSYVWGSYHQSSIIAYNDNFSQPGACGFLYDTPAITRRIVSFDGISPAVQQDFTYSITWNTYLGGGQVYGSWTAKSTTVTTQDLLAGTTSKKVYTYGWVSGISATGYGADNSSYVINQMAVESAVQHYGYSPSYPLLRTDTKNWIPPSSSAGLVLGCSFITLDNGLVSGEFYDYGNGRLKTDTKTYDYGQLSSASSCLTSIYAPASPKPAREVAVKYQTFGNTPIYTAGPSIFDRPCQTITYDSTGITKVAETDYFYDGTAGTTPCVTAATQVLSGTGLYTNHDEPHYGPSLSVSRGNLTKIISQCLQTSPLCSSGNPTGTFVYDETGQVTSKTDARGNPTYYSHTDNFDSNPSTNTNAYLTQITNALGYISKFKYAYTDGQLIQSQNQNDLNASRIGTTYVYNDALRRPTEIDYADGGQQSISYNDVSLSATTSTKQTSAPQYITNTSKTDGMGHVTLTQLTSDPLGADTSETTYTGLGQVRTQTNSHRGTGFSTDGITTHYYDALGRQCLLVPPDGTLPSGSGCPTSQPTNTILTTYSGNCATVTDQAGKSRKSCSDGLGRLTQVIEDPSPGNAFETDYGYDALDNLQCVGQKGTNTGSFTTCAAIPASWRPRTFIYNSLSQLASATNPESGTVSYTYDPNGNLTTKTAPAPNQTGTATVTTTYGYDSLNRLLQKTYSDSTAPAYFQYDANTIWGWALTETVGKLVAVTSPTAGPDPGSSAMNYSYDPMGRIKQIGICTPGTCGIGSFATNYAYDLAGEITAQYHPGANNTLYQTFDGAGRLTQLVSTWVDAQHPNILFSADSTAGFFANGALRKASLGNGLTLTNMYNNRLQPCRMEINSSSSNFAACTDASPANNVLDFTYGYGALNNGNVMAWNAAGAQTFTRSYQYDSLNRLSTLADSATGQACKGLSWTYDPWGNRTDQTVTAGVCGTFHATIATNNRFSSAPYQYDSAGNMTHDASHSYTYDAEGRLLKVDGGSTALYAYDANGQRVRKVSGGITTEYALDGSGNVLAEGTPGCGSNCWTTSYIYAGGSLLAEYKNGTTYFVHKDHLGSTRLMTKMDKTVLDSLDYLPFGEQIAGDTGTTHKFTGKERDSESGLDNFGARYYSSSLARFMSSDPMLNSGRPESPQSWNRYSYTLNSPLNLVDFNGLYDWASSCAKYDNACEERREQFRNALDRVKRARDHYKKGSKEYEQLDREWKSYGTEGDGNKVLISFDNANKHVGTPMYTHANEDGTITVTIDSAGLKTVTERDGGVEYAAQLGHEGEHIFQDKWYATPDNFRPYDKYFAFERLAYIGQSLVNQAFAADSMVGIWNKAWGSIDSHLAEYQKAINHMATESATRSCAQNPGFCK